MVSVVGCGTATAVDVAFAMREDLTSENDGKSFSHNGLFGFVVMTIAVALDIALVCGCGRAFSFFCSTSGMWRNDDVDDDGGGGGSLKCTFADDHFVALFDCNVFVVSRSFNVHADDDDDGSDDVHWMMIIMVNSNCGNMETLTYK